MPQLLATVHLHPALTVPPAVAIAAWCLWYWRRLAAADVPDSRRRIRRASIVVMLMALPFLIEALSFLDAEAHPAPYVVMWLLVLFLLGLVLLVALLDLLNTLRLSRRARRLQLVEAAGALADAIRAARREAGDGDEGRRR